MAAKKSASKKGKAVSVTIDKDTLNNLVDALRAMAEHADAVAMCCDDPDAKAKLKKGAKKGRR